MKPEAFLVKLISDIPVHSRTGKEHKQLVEYLSDILHDYYPYLHGYEIKYLEDKCSDLIDNHYPYCVLDTPIVLFQSIRSSMSRIKHIPQFKQRSHEWYEQRSQIITASEFSKIGGTKKDIQRIVRKKDEGPPQHVLKRATGACEWGIIHEDVAIKIYEKRYKCSVKEFGCIPHKSLRLGASPDGIVSDEGNRYGRMVEIKCPFTRVIDGLPSKMYWEQMQIQMECCDLPMCDFFECMVTHIHKATENTYDLYWNIGYSPPSYVTEKECGIIIVYETVDGPQYEYSRVARFPISENSHRVLSKWKRKTMEQICEDESKNYSYTIYWGIKQSNCITVERNKHWFHQVAKPRLNDFWDNFDKNIEELPEKRDHSKSLDEIFDEYMFQ